MLVLIRMSVPLGMAIGLPKVALTGVEFDQSSREIDATIC